MYLQLMSYKQLSDELSAINKVIEGTKQFMSNTMFDSSIVSQELLKVYNHRNLIKDEIYRRAELIPIELLMERIYEA
jgi:hypothetical protein